MHKEPFHHHSTWRLIHWRWVCITGNVEESLPEFLARFGFDIPDTIEYCLATAFDYRLKFRQSGGTINIYIHQIT